MEKIREELAAAVPSEPKDQTHVLKGKRTKRQRPQSPIPFSIAPNSLYTVEGEDDDQPNANVASPASSTSIQLRVGTLDPEEQDGDEDEEEYDYDVEEEEEDDDDDQDLANCLILLAQGPSLVQQPHLELKERSNKFYYLGNNTTQKFTSRKFMETSSNGHGGKAGYYVYQCKTCDRTFPSFQALGGHRASHKKPKVAHVEEKKTGHSVDSDEEERVSLRLMYGSTNNQTNSNHNVTQVNPSKYGNGSNYNKVHECGICGAEFTSGQALGGHMRRHRGTTASANMALSLSAQPLAAVVDQTYHQHPTKIENKSKHSLSLDLDLNLPAPQDEHIRETGKPGQSPKQEQEQERQNQQKSTQMVFSATPALVDCHY